MWSDTTYSLVDVADGVCQSGHTCKTVIRVRLFPGAAHVCVIRRRHGHIAASMRYGADPRRAEHHLREHHPE
jgi:hypothetical protein